MFEKWEWLFLKEGTENGAGLVETNVFVKPKDPRELAHLGLARTFVQVRAEGKLVFTMPSAAESLKKRTFMKDLIFKSFSQFFSDYQKETREG